MALLYCMTGNADTIVAECGDERFIRLAHAYFKEIRHHVPIHEAATIYGDLVFVHRGSTADATYLVIADKTIGQAFPQNCLIKMKHDCEENFEASSANNIRSRLVTLFDYFNRVLSQWTRINDDSNTSTTQQIDLCVKDDNVRHGMLFSCISVGNYTLLESSCEEGLHPILSKCFRPSIGKSVFQCGMKTIYFLRDHDFTYMVVADTTLGPLVAFAFLNALKEDFKINMTNLKSFWPRYVDLRAFMEDHMEQIMNYVKRFPVQNYSLSIEMVDEHVLQERLRSISAAFDQKVIRIKLLEAAAQQDKDELKEKMIFITGSKDILSFRDIAASSLMKTMEERLCRILWQVLQQKSFAKCRLELERHQVAVHKFERGKFGFQFMDLCKVVQRYSVSRGVWDLLRTTRDLFVQERYGEFVDLDMGDLIDAMVAYFSLRLDRNNQEHLFESTYSGDIPAQRLFLTDLLKALSGDTELQRLKGMEPLLRLEASCRLQKLEERS